MIIAYLFSEKGGLKKVILDAKTPIPKEAVWLDLVEPTIEEERAIEHALSIDAPTREEMDKIEVMSPFYKEQDTYYMTVTVLDQSDIEYPQCTAITLMLTSKQLITLRYCEPKAFNNFSLRAMRQPNLCVNPEVTLQNLVESVVHNLADVLETAGNELDVLLKDVFEKPTRSSSNKLRSTKYLDNIIRRIGRSGDLISKIRESLVSINRMLIFFSQIEDGRYLSMREQRFRFKKLPREVYSLTEYATFLSQKNGFLLDATLGIINIEQNMIIKVFTVAAAIFFPPTLVASVYGMNFIKMPELAWEWGYLYAILLMLASSLIPFLIFKKKGWL